MFSFAFIQFDDLNFQLLWTHWMLSTILKPSNKSVWSNAFWYVKVCIFWKCIQYIEIKQIFKKFPSDKISRTKNTLFILSWAPTFHGFSFNLWFLYELKHKICLSKTLYWIFHFRFRSVLIKVYFFVEHNAWTLWLKNVIIPFKIKIIGKTTHSLAFTPLIFKLQKSFKIQWCLRELELPKNWSGDKIFKSKKSKFWKRLNRNFWVNIWYSFT